MARFFFTADAYDGCIDERAKIYVCENRQKAMELLQQMFTDSTVEDVRPGEFGDCWFKSYLPTVNFENWDIRPFQPNELYAERQNKAFWITPRVDVFVPVFAKEEE